jgi:hypothetical protein
MSDEIEEFFANARAQRDAMFERLAVLDVVEIVGVVGVNGVTAAKFKGDELWDASFTLEAWRAGGGPVLSQPLEVWRRADEGELRRLQAAIPADTVIGIAARLDPGSPSGASQALLDEVGGVVTTDTELNGRAEALRQPVTREDRDFGTLTLNRSVKLFKGRTTWLGKSINLVIDASDDGQVAAALEVARAICAEQVAWDAKILDRAVEELLPLKNDFWLDEGEPALSEAAFRCRLERSSLGVRPDGSFNFYLGDGQIFLGHVIDVKGSLSEGVTEAALAG